MPNLTLRFNNALNESMSIGDKTYYVPTSTTAGFDVNSGNVAEIGDITSINRSLNEIIINTTLASGVIDTNSFILFSKNNAVSMSSILGYFAEIKLTNNSTEEAELHQIGLDSFISSK
tara:strand:+ start:115 stop:468 length:354 start_codon:yes stop_codon:yes gene_type:complete